MKHRLLVEKDKGNTCRKNQEKKRAFFLRIFLEVSFFTALTVFNTQHMLQKITTGIKTTPLVVS
jgi:hypothetical protein